MNLTATQIEDIVRVVVERLQAGVAAHSGQNAMAAAIPEKSQAVADNLAAQIVADTIGEIQLTDRVVTLESVKGQLHAAKSVVVHPKAVVTPAVKDLLRQLSIRLVKRLPSNASSATRRAPLLLVSDDKQNATLGKRVCSQLATMVVANDTTSATRVIQQSLATDKRGAVWCSSTPFASVAATYGHTGLRAVQLGHLQDLPRAIEQAQPNVLIVDCRVWSIPAVANLVRNWTRSLG